MNSIQNRGTNPLVRWIVAITMILAGVTASHANLVERSFLPGGAVDACVMSNENLVFVGNGAGISIFDVTDPENPRPRATVPMRGVVGDVVLNGQTLYASTWNGYVQSIDVTDASNPEVLDDVWLGEVVIDIEVVGNWLIASRPDRDQLVRLNITNPSNLTIDTRLTAVVAQQITAIDDDSAWVGTNGAAYRLTMDPFELSAPHFGLWGPVHTLGDDYILARSTIVDATTFEVKATFDLPGGSKAMALVDGTAYVLDDSDLLHQISLADPLEPVVEASVPLGLRNGTGASISAIGNRVLVASGGSMLVDFPCDGQRESPEKHIILTKRDIQRLSAEGRSLVASTAVYGAMLLIVSDEGVPVDISVPQSTYEILATEFGEAAADWNDDAARRSRTPSPPDHAALRSTIVYGAAGTDGLALLEHDGRRELEEIGQLTFGNVVSVHRDGSMLFVVDADEGIHLLDISDLWNPVVVGTFPTFNPVDCVTRGNILYVANNFATNLIVDISDPSSPLEIGTFPGLGRLAIEGDRMYAPGQFEFYIYDISVPASPVELALNTNYIFVKAIVPVPSDEVPVGEHHAWIARGRRVELLNLTDPTNIFWIERFNTRDFPQDIALAGELVCVADGLAGVSILKRRTSAAARQVLTTDVAPATVGAGMHLSNSPNPVLHDTAVRFSLPAATSARLEIFDVSGRRIQTLIDRTLGVGDHTVRWDGRDGSGQRVAAGMYLYRLQTPERSLQRKMLVVR